MRYTDIKKAMTYLKRIAKDPFSRQSLAALKRYMKEACALVYEKFHGLDFTMVYKCQNNEHNNNYSKSPDRVLKRIFDEIDYEKNHSFIDLGCGKGYVIAMAAKQPFKKVGGVEFSKELCDICRKNLSILRLNDVELYNCDAKEFEKYGEYDIFYFCNPFDEIILFEVVKKIYESHKDKKCTIYYLNPHQEERQRVIRDAGFRLVRVIKDKCECYFDINVYVN